VLRIVSEMEDSVKPLATDLPTFCARDRTIVFVVSTRARFWLAWQSPGRRLKLPASADAVVSL
jgi:hypothetical protein